MTDTKHSITFTLVEGYGPYVHVSCHDETGPCGAAWTCGCTTFAATGINPDGSHWHTSAGGSEIHAVPNEPLYCAIREAAEDAGVEYLTDLTITLPIAHIEWDEGPVLSCDDPGELLDRLEAAEAAADEHDQCPAQCPVCGDWATRTPCDHCKGSGCGPGTALGGYEECEWCAGMGWLHEGCRDTGPSWQERAEAAEAELSREDRQSPELAIKVVGAVARAEAAEAAIERVREVHAPMKALEVRRNQIRQVCTGCGTDDGNWQPYPCPTIRAIDKERR